MKEVKDDSLSVPEFLLVLCLLFLLLKCSRLQLNDCTLQGVANVQKTGRTAGWRDVSITHTLFTVSRTLQKLAIIHNSN